MWWQLAAIASLAAAVALCAISYAIAKPLVRSGQFGKNALGTATSAIFLVIAIPHAAFSVSVFLPALGLEFHDGLALRDAFPWYLTLGDVMIAGAGLWYWSLRKGFGPLTHAPKPFEDVKERRRRALEINDDIVQGLAAAQLALTLDERETSRQVLEDTLASAREVISELVGGADSEIRLGPGDLVRSKPAVVHKSTAGPA